MAWRVELVQVAPWMMYPRSLPLRSIRSDARTMIHEVTSEDVSRFSVVSAYFVGFRAIRIELSEPVRILDHNRQSARHVFVRGHIPHSLPVSHEIFFTRISVGFARKVDLTDRRGGRT